MKYSDVISKAETFDVFLFSGRGKFSSLIEFCSSSKYSHVGIVVTEKDLKTMDIYVKPKLKDPDGLYLFHSNKGAIGDCVDVRTGQSLSGVQINSLKMVLENYVGEYYYRKLHLTHTREHYLGDLKEVINDYEGLPYENNMCELLMAIFPCYCQGTDMETVFCSELVAQTYIQTGIFDPEEADASNNYIPLDFAQEADDEPPFAEGNHLSKEKKVKLY